MKLENIQPSSTIKGIIPNSAVQIIHIKSFGSEAVEITYKTPTGELGSRLLYRDDETTLHLEAEGRPWSFDGNGADFRLVAEAHRIQLAHLFDPLLAVHASNVDPLPHQITAVYESMLPRQPLRFLLADDPGAGKTIMAGLLIKELIARGDLKRCLIVCPGSLATQWQDELSNRFDIRFEILTNDGIESAVTGNWFMENDLAIARLDKLARNEDIQNKLNAESNYYDLVIFDEAHKLSATYFGGEVKYTKRFRMAQKLAEHTRHFLLMTATPHNGKEEDFQLFLSLLDGDRFEGKPREGVHQVDASDLMRRMVKENLLKFDGTPLFPERIAYTASYELSPLEAKLYAQVTEYVRDEFNRAEALQNDKRAGTVGFALTILQRRLASSPEAIYRSLSRRRMRLTDKMKEMELIKKGTVIPSKNEPVLDADDLEDLEDAPDNEIEQTEEKVLDQATAAQTIDELKKEIERLAQLESLAADIRRSGQDAKWTELSSLFHTVLSPASQVSEGVFPYGSGDIPAPKPSSKQKLVVFTEHRDTLNYLQQRITALLGSPRSVMIIHGAMGREERSKAQESFLYDPDVRVLLATDAAGEGINLQRAHLMVNYDLPWNPNRLEQRFGRIHRIGQTEVCHLWNLVAKNTREGEVYDRLFFKLEEARKALGGQVFDVLGKLQFDGKPLRELLLEAIRYGDLPETRSKLTQKVEAGVDKKQLIDMMNDHALVQDSMDTSKLEDIRKNMELAEAQKLQPFYVRQFFMEAFSKLGGSIYEREDERYEIKHVPAVVRNRDRLIGRTQPVLERYERVVFEKKLINPEGKVRAAFLTPGHALLQSVIDITMERHRDLLRQGTILVDEGDYTESPRVLFFIQHSIKDASLLPNGENRTISQRMMYVEMDTNDNVLALRYAPYLDYRPLSSDEPTVDELLAMQEFSFIRKDMEQHALGYAIREMVPQHLKEVRERKIEWVNKTRAAVKERLTHEITYWDHRANELRLKEQAGKSPGTLNSTEARRRADELQGRLRKRLEELDREAQISAIPPLILGGVVVVPVGLLNRLKGVDPGLTRQIVDTQKSAARARNVIMELERSFGCIPTDVETQKKGYDIESFDPSTGHYRLIEVKGRVTGASDITITKNEILTGLNSPEHFILALVEFLDDTNHNAFYLRNPFADAGVTRDFNGTSMDFPFKNLLQKSTTPSK
jgi:SNF2 family DNA or RNA helicase